MSPRKKDTASAAPPNLEKNGFDLLFRNHPVPMWIYDLETLAFLEVNDAAIQKYGYTHDEFLALTLKDIRPAEDVPRLLENTGRTRPPLQHSGKWRHRLKNGEVIDVEITSHIIEFNGRKCALVMARDITERKRVQDALRTSEERFRSYIENANDYIFTLDRNGRITSANQAMCEKLGYELSELLGRSAVELITPELRMDAVSILQKIWGGETVNEFETSIQTRDGKTYIVQIRGHALHQEGEKFETLHIARDITERKRAEDALYKSEDLFRKAFQYSAIGMALVSIDGKWLKVNSRLCSMLGYSEKALLKKTFQDITHPGDLEADLNHVRQMLAGELETYTMEKRYIHKNGGIVWVLLAVSLVKNDDGTPLHFISQIKDITERKQAAEELRKSEGRYKSIAEDMPALVCRFLPDGTLTFINSFYCEYFGKSHDELLGSKLFALIPEPEEELVRKKYLSLHQEKPFITYEYKTRNSKGGECWQRWTDRALFDEQGEIVEYQSIGEDITQRKQAEETLREAEAKYRSLVEKLPVILYLDKTDETGTSHYMSPQVESMLGYPPSAYALDPDLWHSQVYPQDYELAVNTIKKTLKEGESSEEYRMVAADGRLVWVRDTNLLIRDEEGKPQFVQGFIENITARKLAEEKLRRNEEILQLYIEHSPAAIAMLDRNMRHIVVSKHFRKVYRLGDLDIIGKSHYEVFPDLPERWKKAHRRCLEGAVERSDEDFFVHQDGSVDWTKWEIRPWYENDGGIGGIILFVEVITQQKLARDAQRESEERYRGLFDNSPISLWEEDFSAVKIKLDELKQAGVRDFEAYFSEHPEAVKECASLVRIINVNEASVKLYGAKNKAELVRNLGTLLHTDDLAIQFRRELVNIANGMTYFEREEEDHTLNGELLHTAMTWSAVPGHEEDLSRVIVSIVDITERKQAEHILQESEKRFRSLFEDSPISLWEEDFSAVKLKLDELKQDGVTDFEAYFSEHPEVVTECASLVKILDVNKATLKLYEAKSKADFQTNLDMVFEEQFIHSFKEELTFIAKGLSRFEWEGVNKKLNGGLINVALTWSLVPGHEEDLSRVIVSIIDITERKQAEESVRESEEKLQHIIRHSSSTASMFYTHTAEHELVYVSPQSREILDCEPEEAMVHWQEFLSDNPSNRQGIEATERALRTGERQPPFELELITRKGRRICVEVEESPIVRDGKIAAITGSVTDITKRKQAEKEREHLLNTLEASLNEIYMFDLRSLKFEYVNASALHNLGYSFEQMKEMTPHDLKPEFTEDSFRKLIEPLLNGETRKLTFETHHRRADASLYPVEVHLQLVEHEEESIFLAFILNIAERHQLISELDERIKELTLLHDTARILMDSIRPEDEVLQEMADMLPSAWQYPQIAVARVGYNGRQFITPNYRETDWMQSQFFDLPNGDMGFVQIAYLEERPEAEEGPFLNEERRLIELIAEKLQTYLRGTLADRAIKRQLSELETLYESGLTINRLHTPEDIAQALIEILQRRMNWHHIAIRQYDAKTDSINVIGFNKPGISADEAKAYREKLGEVISNPDQGLSGWVTLHGTPALVPNVDADERFLRVFPEIRSGVYVPLKVGKNVIGSISLESETENAFTVEDQRLLETLAGQAAVAIQNANLFNELQSELLERQLIEEQMRLLNVELEQRVEDRTAQIESVKRRLELAAHAGQLGVWEYIPAEKRVIWDERMHIIHHLQIGGFDGTPQGWAKLIHPDDLAKTPLNDPALLTEKMFMNNEYRILLPNGSMRHLTVNAVTVFGGDNKPERVIGICMDVTRNKQAEETLRLANVEMETALRVKDEFLANMSHELRTPLNAILGISESLEEQIVGALNEKQIKYVQTIRDSGRHLLDLINDILDVSKIEAGRMELDPRSISVEKLCRASLGMIKELAQKKSVNILYGVKGNVQVVSGDPRRLKQTLVNLLSNAIKFTEAGKQIGLEVEGHPQRNEVAFSVWDEGIGIAQEDMQYLFKPFVQLDSGLTKEYQGTGLGLALVAQITRLHGGHVSVESEEGRGSRFTVILPWSPNEQTAKPKVTGKLHPPTQRSQVKRSGTILLIEDTDTIVALMEEYLSHVGYNVLVARNGVKGVILAKQEHPDLILMDVMMPVMDGLEATRILRADKETVDIPIIAMTALAMPGDRERCLAAGMNDYMSKPIRMNELVDTIERHLEKQRKGKSK